MQRKKDKSIYLQDYKPSDYLIDKTELRFELNTTNTIVKSELNIRRNPDAKNPSDHLVLQGDNLKLDSIELNNKKLNPSQYKVTSSTLTINDVPDAFKLKINTHLNPKANKSLDGLYITNGVLCTLCEAESFRKLTYFIDRPDVLSSYKTTLVADQKKYPVLLSNGNLESFGKLKNGQHWATWNDPIKKPSYLFVIVAGKFDIVEDVYHSKKSNRDIKIQLYVEKGKGNQCGLAIDMLKKAMEWDELTYDRVYDLDSYKIVSVDDFDASADENTGINIFKSDCLLGTAAETSEQELSWIQTTLPHEFFHHWSGNRVTIRDWFQVSLKEGLTTFREQKFNEDVISPATRIDSVNSLRKYQFPKDIYPVQVGSFKKFEDFQKQASSSIYNKGAEIFRMLETYLGKRDFTEAMKKYFDRFKGKSATFEDYIAVLEEVSKKNLSSFLLWFRTPGTPEVDITDHYDEKSQTYTLKIKQKNPRVKGKSIPLPIPIKMGLIGEDGKAIPLCIGKTKPESEKVLLLMDEYAEFKFKNVASKPTPSLFRGLSAPVKINYAADLNELQHLLKYDVDQFNRMEAGKKYFQEVIINLIANYVNEEKVTIPTEMIQAVRMLLNDKTLDPRYVANILSLPTTLEIAQDIVPADVNAISFVRELVISELAKKLKKEFKELFSRSNQLPKDDKAQRKAVGYYQLQNACLYYMSRLKEPGMTDILKKRFDHFLPINLEQSIAAMMLLADQGGTKADEALNQFYEKWKDEPEKLDTWIQVQASVAAPNTLKQIKKLFKHEGFDINNPEHAFTLMYAFLGNFSACFSNSKESYIFLADLKEKLDQAHPKLGRELVKIVNAWKPRLNDESQKLIETHFEKTNSDENEEEETDKVDSDQEDNLYEKVLQQIAEAGDMSESAEQVKDEITEESAESVEDEVNEEPAELESEVTEEQDIQGQAEQSDEAAEMELAQESDEPESDNESEDVEKPPVILINQVNININLDLEKKTNRQIHNLLEKNGLFKNNSDLRKISSDESCARDREQYKEFVHELLKNNI